MSRLGDLQKEKRETADAGCRVSEHFRRNMRPDLFEQLQYNIRIDLLNVEERICAWEDRRARRKRAIDRFRKRYGPSKAIGEHLRAVELYADELRALRSIFRQIGDAFAWLLLRTDPRIIAPLFAERTHHLTPGRGLVAVAQMIQDTHATGQFFAIDNDLTRCLGDGDVTVVRAGKPWSLPLTLELKTPESEVDESAGEVTVNFTAALSGHPDQAKLHEELAAAIGLSEGVKGRPPSSLVKQAEGMEQRAKLLFALTRPKPQLRRDRSLWPSIQAIVHRAEMFGSSYDEPEPGIVYAAVRLRPGENAEELLLKLLERVQEHIARDEGVSLDIADFRNKDEYSALMPPIALWPLPLTQRAALLGGSVYLACSFFGDVFERAFCAQGLQLNRENGYWQICGYGEPIVFDRLEVAKLRLGVAFNAMSPRELAEVCAQQLRG